MPITVWHNKSFMKYAIVNFTTKDKAVLMPCTICKVAVVDNPFLGVAYKMTQDDWGPSKIVQPASPRLSNHRSTSVGDILQLDNEEYYIVELIGFRKLSSEEVSVITFNS